MKERSCRRTLLTFSGSNQPLELRSRPDDRLVAFGPGGDSADFDTGALFEKVQVRAGTIGQVVIAGDAPSTGPPPRQLFILRFNCLQRAIRGRHLGDIGAVQEAIEPQYEELPGWR